MAAEFTVDLQAVIRCEACGRRWQTDGSPVGPREVADGTDAVVPVEMPFGGPCPGCVGPEGGGEDVVAAE